MQISSLTQQKSLTSGVNYKKTGSLKSTKKNSLLENLMKQKQSLIDYKNSLIDDSLKNNGDPKVLKSKTDEIDKQIEEIDKQISKIQMEEQQKKSKDDKSSGKTNTKKTSNDNYNKSSAEIADENLTEQMSSILKMGNAVTEIKSLNKQRKIMTYEKNTLDAYIATDEARGKDSKADQALVSKIEDGINNTEMEIDKSMKNLYSGIRKSTRSDNSGKIINATGQDNTAINVSDTDSDNTINNTVNNTKKNIRHSIKHINTRA